MLSTKCSLSWIVSRLKHSIEEFHYGTAKRLKSGLIQSAKSICCQASSRKEACFLQKKKSIECNCLPKHRIWYDWNHLKLTISFCQINDTLAWFIFSIRVGPIICSTEFLFLRHFRMRYFEMFFFTQYHEFWCVVGGMSVSGNQKD